MRQSRLYSRPGRASRPQALTNINVAAISVKGKSTALQATVSIQRDAESLHLERIEAWTPVVIVSALGNRLRL